jgi:hypothetical protein
VWDSIYLPAPTPGCQHVSFPVLLLGNRPREVKLLGQCHTARE